MHQAIDELVAAEGDERPPSATTTSASSSSSTGIRGRAGAPSEVAFEHGSIDLSTFRPELRYGIVNRHVDACHLRHPHRERAAPGRTEPQAAGYAAAARRLQRPPGGRRRLPPTVRARYAARSPRPCRPAADSPAAAPAGSGARRRTSSTTPCVPSNRPTGKPASSACGAPRRQQPSSSKRGSNTRTPCASSSLHCTAPTSPAPPESTRSTDGP